MYENRKLKFTNTTEILRKKSFFVRSFQGKFREQKKNIKISQMIGSCTVFTPRNRIEYLSYVGYKNWKYLSYVIERLIDPTSMHNVDYSVKNQHCVLEAKDFNSIIDWFCCQLTKVNYCCQLFNPKSIKVKLIVWVQLLGHSKKKTPS